MGVIGLIQNHLTPLILSFDPFKGVSLYIDDYTKCYIILLQFSIRRVTMYPAYINGWIVFVNLKQLVTIHLLEDNGSTTVTWVNGIRAIPQCNIAKAYVWICMGISQLQNMRYWLYAPYKHCGTLQVVLGTCIAHKIVHLFLCTHVLILENRNR